MGIVGSHYITVWLSGNKHLRLKMPFVLKWLLRERDLFSLSSLLFIILTREGKSRNVTSDHETSSYSPLFSCCLCVIVVVFLQPVCVWFVEHDICVTAVMSDWTYKTKAWAMEQSSVSTDTQTTLPAATQQRRRAQRILLWFSYLMAWLVVTTSTSLFWASEDLCVCATVIWPKHWS